MTDVLVLSGLVCVLMLAGAWLGRRRMRIEYARWLIEQRKLQKPSAFEWEMVKLTVAVQGFAETLGRAMLPRCRISLSRWAGSLLHGPLKDCRPRRLLGREPNDRGPRS